MWIFSREKEGERELYKCNYLFKIKVSSKNNIILHRACSIIIREFIAISRMHLLYRARLSRLKTRSQCHFRDIKRRRRLVSRQSPGRVFLIVSIVSPCVSRFPDWTREKREEKRDLSDERARETTRPLVYAFPLGWPLAGLLYFPSKKTATRKRSVSSNDVVELLSRSVRTRNRGELYCICEFIIVQMSARLKE